jgi:hypothetical protein
VPTVWSGTVHEIKDNMQTCPPFLQLSVQLQSLCTNSLSCLGLLSNPMTHS